MPAYPFRVGDHVELHPLDDPACCCTAKVAAIEADHVSLSRPKTGDGALAPLRAGQQWLLRCFNRRLGISQFVATVLRLQPGPLGEVHMTAPGEVHKTQRRRFVRLPVAWPVVLRGAAGRLEGTLVDLSAGGARILLPEQVEPGSLWELSLALPPPAHELKALGHCVRAVAEKGGWSCSFAFLGLSEADQDRLAGLILLFDARLRR